MVKRRSTRWGRLAVIAAGVALIVAVAVAQAFFSSTGQAEGSATIGSLNPPSGVTAQLAGANVQVTWSAATLQPSGAVQGYYVTRSDATIICGHPTLVTSLSCTDTGASAGSSYTYTVTAVFNGFTATASSASITVLLAPSLTATPSNPSAGTAPSFSFSGGAGTGYQCQLDGGSLTTCTSPTSYTGLSAGSHTFTVRATKGAASGPSASYTWKVDASAPALTATPSSVTASAAASFSFTHSESSYTFLCKLDTGSFGACTSPTSYTGLAAGAHSFEVEGVSGDGATTAAASYAWTIDTSPPSITAEPSNPSASSSPSFSFTHAEPSYTFQCKLDGGSFGACGSPKTYIGLADGSHTFQVLAVAADSSQTQTASYTWLVDTTPPTDALSLAAGASGAYMYGTTLYYKGNAAGSFKLTDTVSDSGSGPASATFPVLSTAGWTHSAQTVSSGTGSAPTIAYTSSTFTWSASPSNPSAYTVTSKDLAGNTSAGVAPTFVSDTTAPAGGALTVDGTVAVAGGSTSQTTATGFTIGARTDYAEARSGSASGLAASILTVQSESLAANSCGAAGSGGPFLTPTTVTGTTQPGGILAGYCYVYTLTGTDNVGNAASISTTVKLNTAPSISSATPSALGQGATESLTITGSGFVSGASASFTAAGITVNSTTFNSTTQLTVGVTLTAGASTGAGTVTVTNPDGGNGSGAFTVDAAPTISSLSPAALGQGATDQTVTVTGTGFTNGTSAWLAATITGHSGVTVNSTAWTNATTLTLSVSVAANATVAASYSVGLTNGDGGTATKANAFTVDAAPTITSLSPAALGQGATGQTVIVTGTGFNSTNPALLAASITGHAGVTVSSTSRNSNTQLTLTLTVAASATVDSDYTVSLTNGDGGTASDANAFTVDAAPTLDGVAFLAGQSNANVTVEGTGFVSGTGLSVTDSDPDITIHSTTFVSATQLTVNVTVSGSATASIGNLSVTNGDFGNGTCPDCSYVFLVASGGSQTSASSINSSPSFTLAAGASYLLLVVDKVAGGATATPSASSFTTSPTFSQIGSTESYDNGAEYQRVWKLTGGAGSGTINVTFSSQIAWGLMGVVAFPGSAAATNVGYAESGCSGDTAACSSTSTSDPATALLPNAPASGSAELVLWSADADVTPTVQSPFANAFLDLNGSSSASGSAYAYVGPATTSQLGLSQGQSTSWGTLAVEIASP